MTASFLSDTAAWRALQKHHADLSGTHLGTLFRDDPARFQRFSFSLPGLLADFSKNKITPETLRLLTALATAAGLEDRRDAMFSGQKINASEGRPVLHTALRAPADTTLPLGSEDIIPAVQDVLEKMTAFCHHLQEGHWTGYTGKAITDIVNIGIGGSSLGPQMVTQALEGFHLPRLRAHFVANVEASDLDRVLKSVSPETTLFIIASKTFTTAETMQNATMAKTWLLQHAPDATAVAKHFVAVSTNTRAVEKFGIAQENMFPFWDWVGGRYSIWSAIGLPVMLMTGADNFRAFLAGAAEMDTHFRTAPLEKNIPVLMGLIGIWYRNFFHWPMYACIPYHSALGRLPAWLQQLDMESNGKSVMQDGRAVPVATGPAIFGEPGTDAQHSFFQWLHQSPDIVPVDFITALHPSTGTPEQHRMLLANCLAQSEALMTGHTNTAEPHRNFSGNRPTTTLLLDKLTPRTLGTLLALYEHKIFVQGVIWGINSFDQWGVELGKALAKTIENEMISGGTGAHDASTAGLMHHIIHNNNT